MNPFAEAGPRWFTIPANRPFLDDLAKGLAEPLLALGPDVLADAVVLVPNRRAARNLAQSFVAVTGGSAVLLPQIRALGDLEEGEPPFEPGDLALDLPPAIPKFQRRFELARLAAGHAGALKRELDAAASLELGDALGAFFDSLEIEEVSGRDRILKLVPEDLAEHWQVSAEFLALVVEAWPRRLKELGLLDVTERQVRLLKRLAAKWDARDPGGIVVAAGSTGSAPATADLLISVSKLSQGAVVLPGLDEGLADAAWTKVDEQHPQGALKRLLERAGIERRAVRSWSPAPDAQGRWRRRVVNEAMRPADATDDWRIQIEALRREARSEGIDPIAQGLAGLSALTAANEEEAAAACAILLREALETPEKTAALITPDQALARRVSARLWRWGVEVDSSAGSPLADCPAGVLISLAARWTVSPADPVLLLAILKHPLSRLGAPDERRSLELSALRGPSPRSLEEILQRLAEEKIDPALARTLWEALSHAAAPFTPRAAAGEAARALAVALEAVADPTQLWAGAGGEAAAGLIAGLIESGEALPRVTAREFSVLIDRLLAHETVRLAGAAHGRIQILGALEGRMIGADRLILAGLEEGVWPPNAPTDPFLSRPMRKEVGLPPPERRIGLSAHDFSQAACAPEVILVHSERRGGQPAVKSRWLWRLETLARGADLPLPARAEVVDWARQLEDPGAPVPAQRPRPTPPVEHRPRKLAVTRVEALVRDPYAVWARDILKLFPLERPAEAVDARLRGTAIHAAFEDFARTWPQALPEDATDQFRDRYLRELEKAGMPKAALAREQALAKQAAQWVAAMEERRREGGARILVEQSGRYVFEVDGKPFELTAKTDRIEVTPQGFGHILDYKTGLPPTSKVVLAGFSPQLTLTAAILAYGTFGELEGLTPGELTYIRVTGRRPAGFEQTVVPAHEGKARADEALAGLITLIGHYDRRETPYLSRLAPQFLKGRSDYDHLARVFEWSTAGDDDGGSA